MKTGELIKKLRMEKGLTQEQLAEKTNLTARTIQRIENGEVDARAYTLQTIASALEVTYEELANCENQTGRSETANKNELWLPLLHLSGLFLLVFPPLLIWVLKKEDVPEMKQHGIDVLNFQFSMLIFIIPAGFLAFLIITIPVIIFLGIFSMVVIILNTIKVLNGQTYNYPWSIQFLKP